MNLKSFYNDHKYGLQAFLALIVLGFIHNSLTSKISTVKNITDILGPDFWIVLPLSYGVIILVGAYLWFANKRSVLKSLLIVVNASLTVLLLRDIISLVVTLPIQKSGMSILEDAFILWFSSLIIFAIWYWVLDRGGPENMGKDLELYKSDLYFPQEVNKLKGWEKWRPEFIDYLFLSFYSAMAFTPTDTLVLSKKMKALLMIQGSISLIILAMIASRAINIIG